VCGVLVCFVFGVAFLFVFYVSFSCLRSAFVYVLCFDCVFGLVHCFVLCCCGFAPASEIQTFMNASGKRIY